jgi:hypothetical protein
MSPFYAVGAELGFPKDLLDLYVKSILETGDDIQNYNEKYSFDNEKHQNEIIENINIEVLDIEKKQILVKSKDKLDSELAFKEEIPNKTKYLIAFWNRLYLSFSAKNKAVHELLLNVFNLDQNDKIPFFKVLNLFKSNKKVLEDIIKSPNGVGVNKIKELKNILYVTINESIRLNSIVDDYEIDEKIIDFLFKIEATTDENINFLIEYKKSQNQIDSPYPIFWMFDLYLKFVYKSNLKYHLIFSLILCEKEYSDEKVGQLFNLHRNRIQQLRTNFLEELPSIITGFKISLSNSIKIDFFESKMNDFIEYEKIIKDSLTIQLQNYRLSFCNFLLSYFNENFVSTGNYIEMFRSKNQDRKKCIAIHLISKKDYKIYDEIINFLKDLSRKNIIRNLYNFDFELIENVKQKYLRDIVVFEMANWSYKYDHTFLETKIEINFENNTISRTDIQNIGLQELEEISDYLNVKNHFKTFYNEDLKNVFSDGNLYSYKSRYNETFKRHFEDIGFVNIASKWVRKDYILNHVSENIFNYYRCSFKDLIVELIYSKPDVYDGKNTAFWLLKLNEILEHNYNSTNNISAILRDERISVYNRLIYLKK